MVVAVHGGSFDPVHVGHLLAGAWVTWTGLAEEVWAVPVASHPFGKRPVASFDERVALLEAVAAGVPWLRVSTIEAALRAPNTTIDTLDALAARHPDHHFRLLIGADQLPDTPRWKDWAGIEARYDPIVVGRQGYQAEEGTVSMPPVSASEIRDRVARGEGIDAFVPAVVAERIRAIYARG
jgi:nicotinate-nucleotide adenylyltransferase